MRRQLLLAAALLAAFTAVPLIVAPSAAYAQRPGQQGGGAADDDAKEAAKKRKRDEEWGNNRATLPALRNAGPCPFVKTLYDAGRYVEFEGGRETSGAVAYSGEIEGISAACEYKDAQPITVKMEVLFDLGRGPMAKSSSKTYRYWIAVTDRNRAVIAKQMFDLPVDFADGADRVYKTQEIGQIVIPRAAMTTSGSNFEVLIGFDVTPEMAAFNREGKRFRLNAGVAAAQ